MSRIGLNKNTQLIRSFGLCLILLGMQTGNFFRSLTGTELVNVLMFLGIVLLFDYKNLFNGRFPLYKGFMRQIMMSQLIILLYAIIAESSGWAVKTESMNFIFLIYSILIILAISSNDNTLFYEFPLIVYVFSTFSIILGVAVITNGFRGLYLGAEFYALKDEVEVDGRSMLFLYGSAAYIHIIASCCYFDIIRKSGKVWSALAVIFILFDIALLIVATKRTVMVAAIIAVLYYIWNKKLRIKRLVLYSIIFIPLLLFIISQFLDIELVTFVINDIYDSMESGLGTLLGIDGADFDESANVRVGLRKWAFSIMESDFSFVNYIFGYGYMSKYLDQPILQCFFDMGVLGIFCYIYIMLLLPIILLLKRNNDRSLLFFKMNAILALISCFTGGLPYGYRLYMSSIFLGASFYAYHTKIKYNEKNSTNIVYHF